VNLKKRSGFWSYRAPPPLPECVKNKVIIPWQVSTSNKTPAFLRREGRRKRKAGAKNEKAIVLYQYHFDEVKGKITQIHKEIAFFRQIIAVFKIENIKTSCMYLRP